MTDFLYNIGDYFYPFFHAIEPLGDAVNWIIIVFGFVLLFFWLNMQKKFNNYFKENGGIK